MRAPPSRILRSPRMGLNDKFDEWYQANSPNVPPNMGGGRVVRKNKLPSMPKPVNGEGGEGGVRRAIIFGLLAQPIFYGATRGFVAPPERQSIEVDTGSPFEDGDAVTSPALEIELVERMRDGEGARSPASLVEDLEERGGSQIFASSASGRWVLPWVGGWERIWSNSLETRFLGGPTRTEFSAGGQAYKQVSVRHFVYGPGDGGLTTEYLHASPSSPEGAKRLLTRQGGVTNLGANLFELSFPSAFKEFEVSTNEKGIDALKTGVALEGGAERESAREILRARTTYLSERMWIIRGVDDPSKVAAFVRTETRSVIDRRGLVAEGQSQQSHQQYHYPVLPE